MTATRQLRDDTVRSLQAIALGRQKTGRVPGVFAGVSRHGALVWSSGIGVASLDSGVAPGADDQFLIASNAKTFTAVMIMQLRDAGRLTLDDLLSDHLPSVNHQVTIRQALAHISGMQREPLGDIWETLEQPTGPELLAGFNEAERVGRPHTRWHYSNLVYGMLGQIVAVLDGRPWASSLQARLLDPLEMRRTSVGFDDGPRATGYYVPPWHDVPRVEPVIEFNSMDAVGGMASTGNDLAKWSAFVASPDDSLLAPDTLEEMCQPQILTDINGWTEAMGLGFFLNRSANGKVFVGHTGGMPGHITGVFTHRESGTGAIVLMNSTLSPSPSAFAVALGDYVLQHDPEEESVWTPGTVIPEAYAELLGRWFTEGHPVSFHVREGRLEAKMDAAPATAPPSVFEEVSPDLYRTVSGRERGELLRVTRNPDGSVLKLNWATYLVTRAPLAFGEKP